MQAGQTRQEPCASDGGEKGLTSSITSLMHLSGLPCRCPGNRQEPQGCARQAANHRSLRTQWLTWELRARHRLSRIQVVPCSAGSKGKLVAANCMQVELQAATALHGSIGDGRSAVFCRQHVEDRQRPTCMRVQGAGNPCLAWNHWYGLVIQMVLQVVRWQQEALQACASRAAKQKDLRTSWLSWRRSVRGRQSSSRWRREQGRSWRTCCSG